MQARICTCGFPCDSLGGRFQQLGRRTAVNQLGRFAGSQQGPSKRAGPTVVRAYVEPSTGFAITQQALAYGEGAWASCTGCQKLLVLCKPPGHHLCIVTTSFHHHAPSGTKSGYPLQRAQEPSLTFDHDPQLLCLERTPGTSATASFRQTGSWQLQVGVFASTQLCTDLLLLTSTATDGICMAGAGGTLAGVGLLNVGGDALNGVGLVVVSLGDSGPVWVRTLHEV